MFLLVPIVFGHYSAAFAGNEFVSVTSMLEKCERTTVKIKVSRSAPNEWGEIFKIKIFSSQKKYSHTYDISAFKNSRIKRLSNLELPSSADWQVIFYAENGDPLNDDWPVNFDNTNYQFSMSDRWLSTDGSSNTTSKGCSNAQRNLGVPLGSAESLVVPERN